jgi:flagellar biosynthesis/type III secretory pathway M-ring protein FliF/YscJ
LVTVQMPGDAPPVSASVRVPRSYFINVYKDTHKGADPDDASLDALVTDELSKISKDVQLCTGIKTPDAVTVNWYDDAAAAISLDAPSGSSGGGTVTTLLTSHVKDIGLGGLAVASLFMLMMMARKSAPAPIPVAEPAGGAAAAAVRKGPQRLGGEEQVVGEVGEGEKTMDGMELDSEAVQTQQVIEQVSSMVAENPDAAATLVKRWLNRT